MRLEQNARPGSGPALQRDPEATPRMRIGIALPRFGELAGPATIASIARHAEALGYDTAWILERDADGIPDALTQFSYLAGQTESLAFGTWLKTGDCGTPDLVRRIGGTNTVAGGRLTVAVDHPAGYDDESLAYLIPARVVEVAPASSGRPVPGAAAIARCQVTYQEIDEPRAPFAGTFAQIGADIAAYRAAGVSELILDVAYSASVSSLDDYLMHLERLRAAAEPGVSSRARLAASGGDSFDYVT